MIDFDLLEEQTRLGKASIKVVGVGGAGGNTLNSMIEKGLNSEIEFIVANTDAQALMLSKATHKVQLGVKSTKGLGTGANPEIGRRAAEEDLDKLLEVIGNADIVFLAAGMGGGTGSGATPVIAKALRERNILTIAVVTKPFVFEGRRRSKVALEAVKSLRNEVDTLLIVPNQKLLETADANVSMIDAFAQVNDVLDQSVRGIANIIIKPGHINVDFADLCTIMRDMGLAVMGTGKATGAGRAQKAALAAISSPLLENMSIKGAKGVLLNITGGKSLGLHEINEAASVVYEQADEDANIILGSVIDDNLNDEIIVTIVATGFNDQQVEISPQVVVQPKTQATTLLAPVSVPLIESVIVLRDKPIVPDLTAHVAPQIVAPVVAAPEPILEAKPVLQLAPQVVVPVVDKTTEKTSLVAAVVAKNEEPVIKVVQVSAMVAPVVQTVAQVVAQPVTQTVQVTPLTQNVTPASIILATNYDANNFTNDSVLKKEARLGEFSLEEIVTKAAVDLKTEAASVQQLAQTETVDIHDLDVPTFLRDKAKENQLQ
jgi:cell division protein FtsZ